MSVAPGRETQYNKSDYGERSDGTCVYEEDRIGMMSNLGVAMTSSGGDSTCKFAQYHCTYLTLSTVQMYSRCMHIDINERSK